MGKILLTAENFESKIWEVENRLGLRRRKDFVLLMEAYRRKHLLNSPDFLVGLGVPSNYESKFFTPSFGKLTPRADNWFKLTKIGLEKMKELEGIIAIDEATKNFVNSKIFRLEF